MLALFLALSGAVGCGDGGRAGDGDAAVPDGEAAYPPIVIVAMIHGDPLPPLATGHTIDVYQKCREAMLWYTGYADETGLRLSIQATGVYAEAVVSQGHASDYVDYGPGCRHHLGQHIHSCTRGTATLDWTCLESVNAGVSTPSEVLQIWNDQVPFVNQILEANGHSAADNWYVHGIQAAFVGMDGPILRNDASMATS
jgi:hypothetical protein